MHATPNIAAVSTVAIDLAAGRVTVDGGERREAVAQAIEDAGYSVGAA